MEYQPIPSPSSGSVPFQFLNSPFGDTTYTKVFVGGLAWETKSDTLRQHFLQYGDILEAVVISDKHTGRSKGYGFVTFRDPDAARRACADPTPVIDGRRANCNLASLGRARPPVPFGRPRQTPEELGSVQAVRGPYVGSFGYQQQQPPISYGYQQQAYLYPPPYGYAAYSPEYLYSQGIYSPYMGQQQYLQVYGVPGTGNSTVYPYGQLSQAVPGGHGYWTMQGYPVSGHQIVRFAGQGVNAAANPPSPMSQTSYPTGIAAAIPSQQHLRFPAPAPQPRSMQGGDSDRTAG